MPKFFTKFRRRTAKLHPPSIDEPPTTPIRVKPSSQTTPARQQNGLTKVDRKIHPDLDSLVDAHLSQHSDLDLDQLSQPSQDASHIFHPNLFPLPESYWESLGGRNSQVSEEDALASGMSAADILQPALAANIISRLANLSDSASSSIPSEPSDPPPGTVLPEGWSTFGRRRPHDTSKSDDLSGEHGESLPVSHLASPYLGRATGRADSYRSEPRQRTPTSGASGSYNTPQYPSSPSRQIPPHGLSSPHTFGNPTPSSSSAFTFGSPNPEVDSHPPLPPLDHPAFQLPTWSTFSGRFPGRFIAKGPNFDITEVGHYVPRPSTSLPVMSRGGSTINARRVKGSRSRSSLRAQKSQISRRKVMEIFPSRPDLQQSEDRVESYEGNKPEWRARARSLSVKSKASSRRTSADFSAKQAMGAGRTAGVGDSWEAQVSREMVRVSLSGGRPGPVPGLEEGSRKRAKSSKARGENIPPHIPSAPSDSVLRLGSPFLLQETHTHTITDTVSGHKTNIRPTAEASQRGRKPSKVAQLIMSQEHDTPSPNPSKGKERDEIAPLPSRRGSLNKRPLTTSMSRGRMSNTSQLAPIPYLGPTSETAFSHYPEVSLTLPTPESSPTSERILKRNSILLHQRASTEPLTSVARQISAPPMQKSSSGGKRKADEAGIEGEPSPKEQPQSHSRATTFAVTPRPHRASATSSYAPSSYQHTKRARLSADTYTRPVSGASGAPSGSWSSRTSVKNASGIIRLGSPASSARHGVPGFGRSPSATPNRSDSRRSISQASIPISALVSPHAPSIARSSVYHMRDPRKPAPVQSTSWSLSLPVKDGKHKSLELGDWVERGGSPLHSWLFFVGFVLFPVWWVASVMRVRRTRRIGGGDVEKGGVLLDDPQLEHDAHSWRTRCRVMAVVSIFTYIPFIVLVAIFA